MYIDPKKYKKISEPKTDIKIVVKNMIFSFTVGGAICCVGQMIGSIFKHFFDTDKKTTAILVTVILISLGAFFTGIKLYGKLSKLAGGGALVPITGFANAITAPAIEFKTEGWISGVGAKMFTIAGPVLVYGISAAVIYGFVYYIVNLFL